MSKTQISRKEFDKIERAYWVDLGVISAKCRYVLGATDDCNEEITAMALEKHPHLIANLEQVKNGCTLIRIKTYEQFCAK